MEALARLESRLTSWMRAVAFVGLVALMIEALVTCADVLLRWLANKPIQGLSEILEVVTAIVIATCFPIVVAERHNIAIRLLGQFVWTRGARWLEVLGGVVLLTFLVVVGWQLAVFTGEVIEDGERSIVLLIPTAPFWVTATAIYWLCIPTQFLLLTIDLVHAVRGERIIRPVAEREGV